MRNKLSNAVIAYVLLATAATWWLRSSPLATQRRRAETSWTVVAGAEEKPPTAASLADDAAVAGEAEPEADDNWGTPERATEPPTGYRTNQSICMSAEFAGGAFDMGIFVFAWRRASSLQRLVDSLLAAEYCGARIPLTFLIDAGGSAAVEALARSVRWPHGEVRVVAEQARCQPVAGLRGRGGNGQPKCEGRGIRGMWIDVLGRELERLPPATHLLPLEDDTEVSPLFYWWLRRASRAYGPFDSPLGGAHRSRAFAGVSLYSPRLNEIRYPSKGWRPRWRTAAGKSPAFLMQLPCSWGALFFRAHWQRFVRFYKLRAAPPFYNFTQENHQRGSKKTREVREGRPKRPASCHPSRRNSFRFL